MPKRIYTDGVFDLFHANHLALLREAKSLGDYLIVGVASDLMTSSYKRRPIIPETERLAIISAIDCVDEAHLIDGLPTAETLEKILAQHQIDLVVYAGDSTPDFYAPAEARGIMRRLPYHDGVSTSAIISRIKSRQT